MYSWIHFLFLKICFISHVLYISWGYCTLTQAKSLGVLYKISNALPTTFNPLPNPADFASSMFPVITVSVKAFIFLGLSTLTVSYLSFLPPHSLVSTQLPVITGKYESNYVCHSLFKIIQEVTHCLQVTFPFPFENSVWKHKSYACSEF